MTTKKVAIIYTSYSGNTEGLAYLLRDELVLLNIDVETIKVSRRTDMKSIDLESYDGLLFGSLTWHHGKLPSDFHGTMAKIETSNIEGKPTIAFGTGDDVYGETYCLGVDIIANILKTKSNIIGKMKVLLHPDINLEKNKERCKKIISKFAENL